MKNVEGYNGNQNTIFLYYRTTDALKQIYFERDLNEAKEKLQNWE